MFDISIVVREDLATWQKLNVVAFLTSARGPDRKECAPQAER